MKHPIAHAVDERLAESLHRIESRIDYRPIKVASWGGAVASVMGAVAASFGAVAAVAGAYIAVKSAIQVSHEGKNRILSEEDPDGDNPNETVVLN